MVKLHKFKIQKKTRRTLQKYTIPRQTQKRKIYSEPIVPIGRETTHENENTDKKNKVEVDSNASKIPKEKENTRSSEPLLHKDYHKNKTDQQMKIYPEEISQKDGKSENKTTQAYQQLDPKSLTFTCTDPKRRKLEEEQCDYDNEEYTMKKESKRN